MERKERDAKNLRRESILVDSRVWTAFKALCDYHQRSTCEVMEQFIIKYLDRQ